MHGNEVFQRVRDALAAVEAERNVRVLFACESGSRAWGFASRESDYDVRFLYVHRRDWYLSVEDRRDVMELPIADCQSQIYWRCEFGNKSAIGNRRLAIPSQAFRTVAQLAEHRSPKPGVGGSIPSCPANSMS